MPQYRHNENATFGTSPKKRRGRGEVRPRRADGRYEFHAAVRGEVSWDQACLRRRAQAGRRELPKMNAAVRVSRRVVCVGLVALALGGMSADTARAEGTCCPNITGCWNCGSWLSCCTGHKGTLRAVITQCDASHYRCTFSGTFLKVVPFRYTVTLTVTRVEADKIYFTASRKIPMFGGSFTTNGYATACRFHANYCSPKDRGTFDMSR